MYSTTPISFHPQTGFAGSRRFLTRKKVLVIGRMNCQTAPQINSQSLTRTVLPAPEAPEFHPSISIDANVLHINFHTNQPLRLKSIKSPGAAEQSEVRNGAAPKVPVQWARSRFPYKFTYKSAERHLDFCEIFMYLRFPSGTHYTAATRRSTSCSSR
jgi:hypothetical protein